MSPFQLLRSTALSKFPMRITSKIGNTFLIQIANEGDQINIKNMVETVHAHSYSFDDIILLKEKEKFPIIYPEFYDINLWKNVVQFKCTNMTSNEVVGTLGIYEEPDGIIYISSFYVQEAFRYEGIGRILWTSCFDFIHEINAAAVQKGFKYRVQLITAKDIYEKAYNFYSKEGFREIPIEFSSPYCTLVKMERNLDD